MLREIPAAKDNKCFPAIAATGADQKLLEIGSVPNGASRSSLACLGRPWVPSHGHILPWSTFHASSSDLISILSSFLWQPNCRCPRVGFANAQSRRLFHCFHTVLVLGFLECLAVSLAVTFPVTVVTDHLCIRVRRGILLLVLALALVNSAGLSVCRGP